MKCFSKACQERLRRPGAATQFLLLAAALFAVRPAQATIRYAVSVAHPEQHVFHVTMTIPNVREEVIVQLPAWNALYQIRDFAYHVSDVRATDDAQKPLTVIKLDKQTWRICGSETVTVRYASYWDEAGPFSSQLSPAHAFLNLATVLFYVPDRRSEETNVAFQDLPPSWQVAIALRPEGRPEGSSGRAYGAPSYDALVDAPVEMGAFEEFRLEAGGRPIRVVVHGNNWNRQQLADTVRRIVDYQTRLMGGAPFDAYLFLYHIGSGAAGIGEAMEHANSTAIFADSEASLASVTAHEFFHLWNVKRIRPQSLEPVDYTREQWTRALWFAEGVTSTYAAYTLLRAGLWSRKQFFEDLAAQITELESRPARRWKSIEEASLDTWFEKYAAYGRPEFSISYYNKGQLLGLLLDILIRDSTENRASLDDLLRALNDDFARPGRFYRDSQDILAEAQALVSSANGKRTTGEGRAPAASGDNASGAAGEMTASPSISVAQPNLAEFFSRYVSGTEELPWADFLGRAGLVLRAQGRARADFGFWVVRGPGGESAATAIAPGSAAEQAGIREGAVLLELNGSPFPRRAERWLRDHRPGETARLRFRQSGEIREVAIRLAERQARTYEIEEAANATPKQRRILEGLLRGTADGPRP